MDMFRPHQWHVGESEDEIGRWKMPIMMVKGTHGEPAFMKPGFHPVMNRLSLPLVERHTGDNPCWNSFQTQQRDQQPRLCSSIPGRVGQALHGSDLAVRRLVGNFPTCELE